MLVDEKASHVLVEIGGEEESELKRLKKICRFCNLQNQSLSMEDSSDEGSEMLRAASPASLATAEGDIILFGVPQSSTILFDQKLVESNSRLTQETSETREEESWTKPEKQEEEEQEQEEHEQHEKQQDQQQDQQRQVFICDREALEVDKNDVEKEITKDGAEVVGRKSVSNEVEDSKNVEESIEPAVKAADEVEEVTSLEMPNSHDSITDSLPTEDKKNLLETTPHLPMKEDEVQQLPTFNDSDASGIPVSSQRTLDMPEITEATKKSELVLDEPLKSEPEAALPEPSDDANSILDATVVPNIDKTESVDNTSTCTGEISVNSTDSNSKSDKKGFSIDWQAVRRWMRKAIVLIAAKSGTFLLACIVTSYKSILAAIAARKANETKLLQQEKDAKNNKQRQMESTISLYGIVLLALFVAFNGSSPQEPTGNKFLLEHQGMLETKFHSLELELRDEYKHCVQRTAFSPTCLYEQREKRASKQAAMIAQSLKETKGIVRYGRKACEPKQHGERVESQCTKDEAKNLMEQLEGWMQLKEWALGRLKELESSFAEVQSLRAENLTQNFDVIAES